MALEGVGGLRDGEVMRIEQCMARFCKNKDWRPIIGIMGYPELVVREGVVKKGGIGMHGVFLLETHVHTIAFLKHNLQSTTQSKIKVFIVEQQRCAQENRSRFRTGRVSDWSALNVGIGACLHATLTMESYSSTLTCNK